MFTGIVEEVGKIETIRKIGKNQLELTVLCRKIQNDLKIGDSVAVDGVCLTVTGFDKKSATFELSSETIASTVFALNDKGKPVNIERALRLSDRLGGHIVQGHIDCLTSFLNSRKSGDFYEMTFSLENTISRYVVRKGSIAVNGTSLTIAEMTEETFSVAVIPHTFENTTFCYLKPGEKVHIESDILARYIERLLFGSRTDREDNSGLSLGFLEKHGFK